MLIGSYRLLWFPRELSFTSTAVCNPTLSLIFEVFAELSKREETGKFLQDVFSILPEKYNMNLFHIAKRKKDI